MYKFIKMLWMLISYIVCAYTIDTIEVTDSIILNYCLVSPIISFIIWILSYCSCKKLVYNELNIDDIYIGSAGYCFFIYYIL